MTEQPETGRVIVCSQPNGKALVLRSKHFSAMAKTTAIDVVNS
jgi:hypothetical protein